MGRRRGFRYRGSPSGLNKQFTGLGAGFGGILTSALCGMSLLVGHHSVINNRQNVPFKVLAVLAHRHKGKRRPVLRSSTGYFIITLRALRLTNINAKAGVGTPHADHRGEQRPGPAHKTSVGEEATTDY
jgi:hypothetical protein